MTAQYRKQCINRPVSYKEPGKKEMPTAARCQPLAAGQGCPVREYTNHRERIVEIRGAAPIKRRMGVEDLQPAHQQNGHADDIYPMRDPDPKAVAIDQANLGHGSLGGWRREGWPKWAVPPGAGASIRDQDPVNDLDDAIALVNVRDRDMGGAALLVGHDQVLASPLYSQRLTLHGLEHRPAAAHRDLLVERPRIEATRHDLIGQDLVQCTLVLWLQQSLHRPRWQCRESRVGRRENGEGPG